jgi:hypothetical protein
VFQDFERLDFFDVSNAILSGPIPDSLFDISTLRLVYMSNNTLTGTIPINYAKPPLLRDLYLDGNAFTGTVPRIFPGELLDLNEFLLHFNALTGSMPASVCDLRGNTGNLEDLFSDCGGQTPEIECLFPECCNRCFEQNQRRQLEGGRGRRQRDQRKSHVQLLTSEAIERNIGI